MAEPMHSLYWQYLASYLPSYQGIGLMHCVHYRFLEADLAAVNRSHTPWLVVGGHRPFYIDSTNAAPGWGDLTVADDLQDALEDLFLQHQVRNPNPNYNSAQWGTASQRPIAVVL